MGPVRELGAGSLAPEFRKFKRRLKRLLQNTAETQEEIVALLQERHVKISRATISRWMQEDNEAAPDQREMLALLMSHTDISVDWLLGRKPADSIAEKYIESRI